MADDLVKRLRKRKLRVSSDAYDAIYEACDRIEQLEAALRNIIGALDDPSGGQHVFDMRFASSIARAALGEKKDD